MRPRRIFCSGACHAVLALLLLSCQSESPGSGSGGEGGGPAADEDPCCTLGAVCHVAGEAPSAEVEACHALGHSGDTDACAEDYDHCIAVCDGVTDDPVPHACQ